MYVYEYDIAECYPRILDLLDINLPQLNCIRHNKAERSIFLGKLFKLMPILGRIVQCIRNDIIEDYCSQLNKSDILLVKGDGFLTTKPLKSTNCSLLPIRLKYTYRVFLMYEKSYVGLTVDNKCIVKGVQNKTIGLESWWRDILLNLSPPYIQNKINEYFTTNDLKLFAIPHNDEFIFVTNNGSFSSRTLSVIVDVDKQWYFRKHVLPFVRAYLDSLN